MKGIIVWNTQKVTHMKFARFERNDALGKLRVYQISEIGWNDMQLKAVGEAGSHETFSF